MPRDFHTQAAQLLASQAQAGEGLSVWEERVGVLSEIRQCDNPCFSLPGIKECLKMFAAVSLLASFLQALWKKGIIPACVARSALFALRGVRKYNAPV